MEPTYIFKDGQVYTMVEGRVVASVKEADFSPHPIDGQVEMPEAPAGILGETCPTCGQQTQPQDSYCPACGTPLQGEQAEADPYGESANVEQPMAGQAIAQTVTTPNGLKGRVLARTPDIWGDTVTIRFENGSIKQIPIDAGMTFAAAEESPEGKSTVQALDERLAATVSADRGSLLERGKELDKVRLAAKQSVEDASDTEAAEYNRIYVQASHEQNEIKAVLDHIQASEAYEAPAPIENLPEVTQASTGGSKADWLENTLGEIIVEANETDYEKLMDEGPEAFVAGLTPDQLADTGTARVMASREIRSHTAGADEDMVEAYEKVWLARVEAQRKEQLAAKKDEVRKEASSDEGTPPPDASLFL